jgi:hypothetical protein
MYPSENQERILSRPNPFNGTSKITACSSTLLSTHSWRQSTSSTPSSSAWNQCCRCTIAALLTNTSTSLCNPEVETSSSRLFLLAAEKAELRKRSRMWKKQLGVTQSCFPPVLLPVHLPSFSSSSRDRPFSVHRHTELLGGLRALGFRSTSLA